MKKKTDVFLNEFCYVLPRVDEWHKITELRHDLAWYPEDSMTLFDTVNYRRFLKSVVTENPFIISCYPRENVRYWDDKYGWREPDEQTYGCSVNGIMHSMLGVSQTIPSAVYDGGEQLMKEIKEINKIYKKSQKLNLELKVFSD